MKRFFLIIFFLLHFVVDAYANDFSQTLQWWNDEYPKPLAITSESKALPLIQVSGNSFVTPENKNIIFRGVSISDPDKIRLQGHWNKSLFKKIKEFGAMIVRIPIHPASWRKHPSLETLNTLSQAVSWCTELKMYIIIDWHSIGNLKMELFQDPMYDTTQKETYEFWRAIATHFQGHNTIAFYELFNEPALYHGKLGTMTWPEWKAIIEDIIHLIRAYDNETIPLVGGFDWAYDLTSLHLFPINAERIAYVSHPYAYKRTRPWEPKWEIDFGFASNRYPVIATEIGFTLADNESLNDLSYGNAITRYLESKGIGWVAWCFDPEWSPTLIKSWDFDLTGSGEFFKEAMKRPLPR